MEFAYIQLGGLRVGIDESEFHTFTGYLGDVINDDVISAGSYRTGKISYTFTGGNGFSAVIALEQVATTTVVTLARPTTASTATCLTLLAA